VILQYLGEEFTILGSLPRTRNVTLALGTTFLKYGHSLHPCVNPRTAYVTSTGGFREWCVCVQSRHFPLPTVRVITILTVDRRLDRYTRSCCASPSSARRYRGLLNASNDQDVRTLSLAWLHSLGYARHRPQLNEAVLSFFWWRPKHPPCSREHSVHWKGNDVVDKPLS
jgi:hypothetical protein